MYVYFQIYVYFQAITRDPPQIVVSININLQPVLQEILHGIRQKGNYSTKVNLGGV